MLEIAARSGWAWRPSEWQIVRMNDYERIANVIRYLDQHHLEQPALTDLARGAGLSPFHFHRLFSTWAGVTPKDFLQCLTIENVKRLLRNGENVLDTALNVGLSGPGRLHDLCVTLEAASPGELKSGGIGSRISYGFADTPFGKALIAETSRGICHLSFINGRGRSSARDLLPSVARGRTSSERSTRGRTFGQHLHTPAARPTTATLACIRPWDTFSGPSLAGFASCSSRFTYHLWPALRRRSSSKGGSCCRQRRRRKSNCLYYSVSSRHPRNWCARELPLESDSQTRDHWMGNVGSSWARSARFQNASRQRRLAAISQAFKKRSFDFSARLK